MQTDMHYFGTYAMARAAGLSSDACQIIATAAEFVDKNGKKESIPFDDGGRLDFIPTAHHATNVANIDRHDQRLVWLPFHFIPGNEGESVSERLLCRKDSKIAREMVEHNLSLADRPFGLYLIGISAHIYADTFSHYGFSGVSSRSNRIDSSSFQLHGITNDIRRYIEEKAQSFQQKYGTEMASLENFRQASLMDRLTSDAAEQLSGALGHGAALTYPDRPYLKWQFDYEHPEKRSSGLRDNPATFLEACEKLHGVFCRFGERRPDVKQDKGRPFGEIRESVKKILAVQAKWEDRVEAWKKSAENGELFLEGESIRPYKGHEWMEEIDVLKESENSSDALESHIFRFFQAAALHRTFVLRDLLPKHKLVVD